jgi:hypothetical protein
MALDMTKAQALTQLSKWMGVNESWLDGLIRFESGWDPAAENKISGARGLIQFMPSTAKILGYRDADDLVEKYPDIPSQLLGPVAAYFKLPASKGPWPTKQSLYMSVFYPAYRSVTPDTMMSSLVRSENPGIDTVQDYMNFVEGVAVKKSIISAVKNAGFPLAVLLIGGLYFGRKYGWF